MIGWLLRMADSARHRARMRRWEKTQAAGRRGEDLAHRYLERQGFSIVARNHRAPSGRGEIDLVAWERDTLVFVEVKTRHSVEFGVPERNVDAEKRNALLRAARDYARRAGVPWERVRFDLVSVVLSDPPAFTHTRDAFKTGRAL
ncbi:MAG TPA: YraN family protein [Bryobacteraceae bacterium]|nr:YraN family protein [Bryobacteraceae bacterium]HPQ15515.1 YraN family protein [Bryobacteraceae bacterium]